MTILWNIKYLVNITLPTLLFYVIEVFINCMKSSVVFHCALLVAPSIINKFSESLCESLIFE